MNLTPYVSSSHSGQTLRWTHALIQLGGAILCLLFWHETIVGITLSILFCFGAISFLPLSAFRHLLPQPPSTSHKESGPPVMLSHPDKLLSAESILANPQTVSLPLQENEKAVLAQRLNNLESLFTMQKEVIAARERNRLARDLHDGIKQEFYALGAQIQIANEVYRQPQRVQKHLQEATLLLQNIQEEMKNLIQNLRPAVLKEKGLEPALRAHVTSWSRLYGIPTRFIADPQISEVAFPLGQEQEEAIFRVMQETLSNVARHSGAWHVEMRFSRTSLETVLSIIDNGCGFDPEHRAFGMGILSMQERFQALRGTVQIDSTPGQGTTVVASFKH